MRCIPFVRLPLGFRLACRRLGVRPTRHLLVVSIRRQRLSLLEWDAQARREPALVPRREFVISTSRFGIGQVMDNQCTPLGLHRIGRKAGGGWPIGVVLVHRQPVGWTWQGLPDAAIAHRVLWLEGLEPGFNRGGRVDSFARTIYIHGVGNEMTLGRPASRGCVHLAARDLMPLYERLPVGTLVWISAE